MRTWENFKKEASNIDNLVKEDIEEMEKLADIINVIIEKRNELGYSQRALAELCSLPQSTVARIESCNVKPNIETLLQIMKPLGLTLEVTKIA